MGLGSPGTALGSGLGLGSHRQSLGPSSPVWLVSNPGGSGEAPAGTGRSVREQRGEQPLWEGHPGAALQTTARLGSESEPVGATGTGRGGHWCLPASLCPAETRLVDQRRPFLSRLWTLPALPVFDPCKQEPIRGCVPISLNLFSTHFLCLATEVLTLTPSPSLGGLSSTHGLDQSRFPGRLSALSRGLDFRQNFWKAGLTPPLVTWEQSLPSCGPDLLPGVVPRLRPTGFKPRCPGAGVPRDCMIRTGASLPASLQPPRGRSGAAAPRERRGGWTEEGKENRAPQRDPRPPSPQSPPT